MFMKQMHKISMSFLLTGFVFGGAAWAQSDPPPAPEESNDQAVEAKANEVNEPAPKTEEKKTSWTDHLKLKGDIRDRIEMIKDDDNPLRTRNRLRARLVLEVNIIDDLNANVGIGTGTPKAPDGDGDPKSNNQTFTNGFSSKFIWINLAYFDYHPSWISGLSAKGGKMENPLYTVGKSELLWDSDINPEGFSLSYSRKFGRVEPFLHGVSYIVEERKEDKDDSWLLGAQAGLNLNFGNFYALLGGNYMDYTNIKGNGYIWDVNFYGNSAIDGEDKDKDGEPDEDLATYAYDFNILGGFAEVGGEVWGLPWAIFGDLSLNTAASNNNTAWLVGALLGKTKEQWDFYFRYIYRVIESDSVFGLFTDSDFIGGNTDGKGHEFNFSLALHKHVQFGATYFFNQYPVNPASDEDLANYHRIQLDLSFKF